MSNFITFVALFGSTMTGIGTVGYRQVGAAGATIVARATAGVYEIGGGAYGVEVVPTIGATSLEWDTGGGSPIFAHEDLLDYFNKKALINKQHTDPGTGKREIYEEDDATLLVQGDVFEDVAGTTPYDGTGTGIDRSDRMS
jgi:hypothetical protein